MIVVSWKGCAIMCICNGDIKDPISMKNVGLAGHTKFLFLLFFVVSQNKYTWVSTPARSRTEQNYEETTEP